MIIKIDHRESELLKKIQFLIDNTESFKSIQILVENLPLADIIINNGIQDLIIIERKSLNDLSASIKDGRYEEQSYRLNGIEHHNHNIVYLIEGDINNKNSVLFKDRVDKTTLYSAMVSIVFYKGFSLMRSFDMSETAYMICNMAYKIGKTKDRSLFYSNQYNPDPVCENDTNDTNNINTNTNTTYTLPLLSSESNKAYCNVVKRVKKENVTKENIGEIMLCQIPGISSQTACAILDKFKNIGNLMKTIQMDSGCLDDVYTVDSKNKSRKISKTCIANIMDFLRQ